MTSLKFIAAIVFFVLSAGYLFYPKFIINLNSFFRDQLFNDAFIITRRRQLGLLFLLLALLSSYMGISAWKHGAVRVKQKSLSAVDRKILLGRVYYNSGKYNLMLNEYKQALALDNHNLTALKGIGLAWLMMGERKKATNIYEQALRIAPEDAYLRKRLRQLQEEQLESQAVSSTPAEGNENK
ncbi:MAG: hypothetical protein ABII74_04390 [Elusimicrobiota bacterium]